MNNLPESTLPPPRTGLRLLRGLALFGLALGFAFIGELLLLALFPQSRHLFSPLLDDLAPRNDAGIPLAFALVVLTPLGIGYAARWLWPHSFRHGVFLFLIAATALVANLVFLATFPTILGMALAGLPLTAGIIAASRPKLRSPRSFIWFGMAVGFILTMDLVLIASFPSWFGRMEDLLKPFVVYDPDGGDALVVLTLSIALIGIIPLAIFAAAWWLRHLSWRWIGGGYFVLAPVFAYLATDDAVIRRPMTMEEIAPSFPGAEKSFEVLMRYGKNHPHGRDFRAPQRIFEKMVAGESIDPGKPAEWLAWLKSHRTDIETDWAELGPVRTWWSELNAFDRIGDLTPSRFDAEIITFAPPRTMTQHACAIAGLQALDGHGDEAIETLLPILQVGRKLQPSARTLVRQMVAIIIERTSLQTADFVLANAAVSPVSRARLAAALSASGGGVAGARRLMAMEYAFYFDAALDKPLGDLLVSEDPTRYRGGMGHRTGIRLTLNVLGPFVYNPRATYNLYGDFVADMQEIVASRRLDQLNPRGKEFFSRDARPRFKNFIGALMIGEIIPAYSKVAESYWKTQDLRAALLARVTQN